MAIKSEKDRGDDDDCGASTKLTSEMSSTADHPCATDEVRVSLPMCTLYRYKVVRASSRHKPLLAEASASQPFCKIKKNITNKAGYTAVPVADGWVGADIHIFTLFDSC